MQIITIPLERNDLPNRLEQQFKGAQYFLVPGAALIQQVQCSVLKTPP